MDVEIDGRFTPLERESDGYYSGHVATAGAGTLYRLRLDGGASFPDPASRFQPQGPHGPSQIIDPSTFPWTDSEWQGPAAGRQVIYEMHVGTFTPAGTWEAAIDQLPFLAELGITVTAVMPVAEFPGRFGWGYDGVSLFAPYHEYGTCDDFRRFVNEAHQLGLAVVLDVVYNHVGPDGNYLPRFSRAYFSVKHKTDWGDAINYDGEHSEQVREFVTSNVAHWIGEYHLDGLRLDATQAIEDNSETHILREIGAAARRAAGPRRTVVIAESEPQDPRMVRAPADGGYGLQHLWCDDFHHVCAVAAGGKREAYLTDYRGSPQEFVSALKRSILYQGQRYAWQKKRRGTPAWDVERWRCVFYLENHDQVANSRDGKRLHQLTSPGRYRALTAVLLLAPQTPLLFQGQEFGSTRPFLYFADHKPELARLVRKGRGEFMAQFPSIASLGLDALDDPASPRTFERSRLDPAERSLHPEHVALHRDLIALRRRDPVLSAELRDVDGAVLGEHAFVVRYFGAGSDRLLLVNLGPDVALEVASEPLLAPARAGGSWRRLWHSDDPRYGGRGAAPPESEDGTWRIPGESAVLLASDLL